VRIDPRTDVPDRFRSGAVLDCDGVGPLTVRSVRGEAAAPIVLFAGYLDRPSAETLRDRYLRVSKDEARRATKGSYLWADLIGLRAETPDGRVLGTVTELIRPGSADVLVIVDGGTETLLPMLDSVVREVDIAGGRIVVTPLEELS